MKSWIDKKVAVWALTPQGAALAIRIGRLWPQAQVFVSSKAGVEPGKALLFDVLSRAVREQFNRFDGHVFIMAAGITVRVTAGLLAGKTKDPAVVVADEAGQYAISLVSGHIGGANALARQLGVLIGVEPVITTSTDVNKVPSIDVIATERGWRIENPAAIQDVSMAFVRGETVPVHDPHNLLKPFLPRKLVIGGEECLRPGPGIVVDYTVRDWPDSVLVLRPRMLVAGVGCRHGVPLGQLRAFVEQVFAENSLSLHSLDRIATVDIKADEPGLLALSRELDVPLQFFSNEQLNQVVEAPNPSALVEKHIGAKSVCEAAALIASSKGKLLVPKQTAGGNATLAIARMSFT